MFAGIVAESFDEEGFAWVSARGFADYLTADYREVLNADSLTIGEAVAFKPEVNPRDRRWSATQIRVLTGVEEESVLRTPIMPPVRGFNARNVKR